MARGTIAPDLPDTGSSAQSRSARTVEEPERPGQLRPKLADGRFSATAFRSLVRANVLAGSGHLPGVWSPDQMAIGNLERAPEVNDAWVYGVYAAVLNRVPDGPGLRIHVDLLRAGADPRTLIASLLSSDEAVHLGSEAPEDLDAVYVTGAYLVALGRAPDAGGLVANRAALASGAVTYQELLDALLESPEATAALRYPPPAAEQYGAEPGPGGAGGVAVPQPRPPRHRLRTRIVLGQLKRHERTVRSAVRQLVVGSAPVRPLVNQAATQVDASAQRHAATRSAIGTLRRDVLDSRTFQWRVDQKTWATLESVVGALNRVEQRLDSLEAQLGHDGSGPPAGSSGSE